MRPVSWSFSWAAAREIDKGEGGALRDLVPSRHAARLYPRVSWARRQRLARHGLLSPVEMPNGTGYGFRDLRILREVDEMLAAGLTLAQAISRLLPRAGGQLELRFPMADVKPRPKRVDLLMEKETAEAWFDVGFCADRDRDGFPTAIAAYQRALEIDPDHVPSLINLGNVYYELGDYEKAREIYARGTLAESDNPRTHFNLGNACDETGDMLGGDAGLPRRAGALAGIRRRTLQPGPGGREVGQLGDGGAALAAIFRAGAGQRVGGSGALTPRGCTQEGLAVDLGQALSGRPTGTPILAVIPHGGDTGVGRRTQVVKGKVCKTFIREFESRRRLSRRLPRHEGRRPGRRIADISRAAAPRGGKANPR